MQPAYLLTHTPKRITYATKSIYTKYIQQILDKGVKTQSVKLINIKKIIKYRVYKIV